MYARSFPNTPQRTDGFDLKIPPVQNFTLKKKIKCIPYLRMSGYSGDSVITFSPCRGILETRGPGRARFFLG